MSHLPFSRLARGIFTAVILLSPWLAGAVLLLVIAYTPPIAQTLRSNFPGAPPYTPDNPVPISTPTKP